MIYIVLITTLMINGGNINDSTNADIIHITPISTNLFNQVNIPTTTKELFYYDYSSRCLIHITKKELGICNKRGNNILIHAKILLPVDKTELITIEPNLTYCLILIQTKSQDKTLLVINLITQAVIGIVPDNYNDLRGMIFLSPTHLSKNVQQYFFCLIYKHKLLIKMIENQTEKIYDRNEISYSNSIVIEQFLYDKTYKILCCCKSDNTFDFYNCSNELYMIKSFTLKQIKIEERLNNTSKDIYKKTQYYLQTLNNELFFIVFNIDQNKLVLYQLRNLNDVFNEMEIILHNDHKIQRGTLSFVNNLIMVIDCITWRINLISIHSLSVYLIVASFIYSNPLGLDCGDMVSKGGSIIQFKSVLYQIDFNWNAFYDSFPYKLKQNALMTLLERKGSKKIIIESIKDMITKRVKINRVFLIIKTIADQVYKGNLPPYSLLLANQPITASDLIIPFESSIKHHKRLMKQSDGFYLFKALENIPNLELDLLRYIMIFNCLIHSYKIKPEPHFSEMLHNIIIRIPIHKLMSFITRTTFLDNKKTAVYLLNISQESIKGSRKIAIRQIALDMLIRLKEKEYVFEYLLTEGNFTDALLFYTKHRKSISSQVFKESLQKYINPHNRKSFLQYISK